MALKKTVKKQETVTESVVEKEVETTAEVEEATKTEQVETVVEKEVETTAEVEEATEEEVETKNVPAKTTHVPATKEQVKGSSEIVKASAGFSQEAAEQGFEGLEVGGYGTFPTIVIGTSGSFEIDGEEEDFKTIVGRLETTKALYLCKQKGVNDGPTAFTYDQINLTGEVDKCTTVAELRQAWEEDGEEMEIKKYLEVLVEVVDENDDKFGEYYILKIAPSSTNKFNGIPFLAARRGIPLNTVVVEFGVGKRRESKSGQKYTPWAFKDVTKLYA